jgi:hypothetical protein
VLLLLSVLLALEAVDVARGGMGLRPDAIDTATSLLVTGTCTAYLYGAAGTVYGARGVTRVAQVATLALAATCVVLGYRFLLFLVTLYGT